MKKPTNPDVIQPDDINVVITEAVFELCRRAIQGFPLTPKSPSEQIAAYHDGKYSEKFEAERALGYKHREGNYDGVAGYVPQLFEMWCDGSIHEGYAPYDRDAGAVVVESFIDDTGSIRVVFKSATSESTLAVGSILRLTEVAHRLAHSGRGVISRVDMPQKPRVINAPVEKGQHWTKFDWQNGFFPSIIERINKVGGSTAEYVLPMLWDYLSIIQRFKGAPSRLFPTELAQLAREAAELTGCTVQRAEKFLDDDGHAEFGHGWSRELATNGYTVPHESKLASAFASAVAFQNNLHAFDRMREARAKVLLSLMLCALPHVKAEVATASDKRRVENERINKQLSEIELREMTSPKMKKRDIEAMRAQKSHLRSQLEDLEMHPREVAQLIGSSVGVLYLDFNKYGGLDQGTARGRFDLVRGILRDWFKGRDYYNLVPQMNYGKRGFTNYANGLKEQTKWQ